MASCVKLLAVPGPPPGPWDAKAALTHNKLATVEVAAKVKCDIRGILRDNAMTISCDEQVAEDTDNILYRF
jgi:hypothetical protein